jgi:hypothetical protein
MALELKIMQHHDKMCVHARDTHWRIMAALLRRLLEPTTPKGCLAQHEIHPLLEHMVVQQAESLAS